MRPSGTPWRLIYEAAGAPSIPPQYTLAAGECAVCAGPAAFDLAGVLGDSFTNWTSCARPSSQAVCAPCLFCLREPRIRIGGFVGSAAGLVVYETPPQTKARLTARNCSQGAILDRGAPVDPRAAFWRVLADPPVPPFVAALNVAGGMPIPKHMPLVSRIATDRAAFPVTYCLDAFEWRPSVWTPAYDVGARALAAGVWISEIERGEYRSQTLRDHGPLARELESVLGPLRRRAPFALLVDLLPRPPKAAKET